MSRCVIALMMVACAATASAAASADDAAASGSTQLHLDLFDFSSPGYGFWLQHTRLRGGAPSWQIAAATGLFNHYDGDELADVGWGRAIDRRFFARFTGHIYLWRGLFAGLHGELMWRRVRRRDGAETVGAFLPTVQPAVGYALQPWGWRAGRFGLMLWIAPRIVLRDVPLRFADGEAIHDTGRVEFASGLNLTLNLF